MVFGKSTPPKSDVLYCVSALWTAVGVYLREDEIRRDHDVRPTYWAKCVSEAAYENVWRRRFLRHGPPHPRTEHDLGNLIEAWLLPFSQFSDHEGYSGDREQSQV